MRAHGSALLLFLGLGVLPALVWGQVDAPGPGRRNRPPKPASPAIPPDSAAADVPRVLVADTLIRIGRAEKSPEALIAAARILTRIRLEPLDAKSTETKPSIANQPRPAPAIADVPGLLDEAVRLSGHDPLIGALAARVGRRSPPRARASGGGPRWLAGRLGPDDRREYTVEVKANAPARIALQGDGTSTLALCVYSPPDALVEVARDYGDGCTVTWSPTTGGPCRIVVINRGKAPNDFVVVTN